MSNFLTLPQIDETTEFIRQRISIQPRVGMILGSGLGGLAASIENPVILPYAAIPNWPISTVVGHGGQLVIGHLGARTFL
jgi:purine-nucleoside phosphorylase